jgi:hypothetical protein
MASTEAVLYGLPQQGFIPTTIEERLVPLIDGVVEFHKPTTFIKRRESIAQRYLGNEPFLRRFADAATRAEQMLGQLHSDLGISTERHALQFHQLSKVYFRHALAWCHLSGSLRK